MHFPCKLGAHPVPPPPALFTFMRGGSLTSSTVQTLSGERHQHQAGALLQLTAGLVDRLETKQEWVRLESISHPVVVTQVKWKCQGIKATLELEFVGFSSFPPPHSDKNALLHKLQQHSRLRYDFSTRLVCAETNPCCGFIHCIFKRMKYLYRLIQPGY